MNNRVTRWLAVWGACCLLCGGAGCAGGGRPAASAALTTVHGRTAADTSAAAGGTAATMGSTAHTSASSSAVAGSTRKPSAETTQTAARSTSRVTASTAASPADDRLRRQGFGFFGPSQYGDDPALFDALLGSDAINTLFAGPTLGYSLIETLQAIDRRGKTAWLTVADLFFDYAQEGTSLRADWQMNLDELVDTLRGEGLLGCVRGFYFDEPFLNRVRKADFITVCGYVRRQYPALGTFACFSVTPILPSLWRPAYEVPELDAAVGRVLTDVAYDYYEDAAAQAATFDRLTKTMKEKLQNAALRVWYIPCTMAYRGRTDEAYARRHLEAMAARLAAEEHPGGLLGYALAVTDAERETIGNVPLADLLAPSAAAHWSGLADDLQQTGRRVSRQRYRG